MESPVEKSSGLFVISLLTFCAEGIESVLWQANHFLED